MTPLTFVFNEIRRSFRYVFNNLHRYFKPASNRSQNLHVSVMNPWCPLGGPWGFRWAGEPSWHPCCSLQCHDQGHVLEIEVMGWVGSAVPLKEGGWERGFVPHALQPPQAPAHILFLSNFPHTKSGFFITQFWSVIKH